jgi:hypothetical protein
LETCIAAQSDQVDPGSIDCDTTVEELFALSDLPIPAACAPIEEKCPELLSDDEEE